MIFNKHDSKDKYGNGPKWKKRINDEREIRGYCQPGEVKRGVNLTQIFKRKQTIKGVSTRLYSPEVVENAAALSREFYRVLQTSFNGNNPLPNKLNTLRNYNGYGKNWPMTAMSLDTKKSSLLTDSNDNEVLPSRLEVVEVKNKI